MKAFDLIFAIIVYMNRYNSLLIRWDIYDYIMYCNFGLNGIIIGKRKRFIRNYYIKYKEDNHNYKVL